MRKKKVKKREKKIILAEMEKGFGIPKEVFKKLDFFKTKKRVYVCTKECLRDELFSRAETAGIGFARPSKVLKPTTDMLQLFGKHAKKNVVELSKEKLKGLIKEGEIEIGRKSAGKQEEKQGERGYMLISYKKQILGCGFLKEGMLESKIPKARRALLRSARI